MFFSFFRYITVCSLLFLPNWISAKEFNSNIKEKVHHYRSQNQFAILNELFGLLSIPNVASDTDNIQKNANHLISMLQRRGLKTQLLQLGDSPPVVYGELRTAGANKTIVLYMHYDGQPVNRDRWETDPWKPVLLDKPLQQGGREIELTHFQKPLDSEGRIYARSASDDKGPIIAALTAIDALKAENIPLSVNVKFFFEGEEEAGSPNLEKILQKYSDLLKADVWLFCDGPVHQTRRQQIVFGVRGVTGLYMTTYGAVRPLHSGHYGNWAPNPIVLLTHLINSMRSPDGQILIKEFYDDVRSLTASEHKALSEIPNIDEKLKQELGLAWTEGNGKRLEQQIMLPAINLRNIHSGGAAARNAIQTEATAVLGFRLVPNQTLQGVREKVETHITQQGFHIVYEDPQLPARRKYPKIIKLNWGDGYEPFRTSMDLPVAQALIKVIEESLDQPVIKMPTLGGSLPLFLFEKYLHTPLIIVPIVNHDNNQHAENENLRLQNLWDGIELYSAILAKLGEEWK